MKHCKQSALLRGHHKMLECLVLRQTKVLSILLNTYDWKEQLVIL